MWQTVTKAKNRKFIRVYYSIALVFVLIGLFTKNAQWYGMAAAFLILASIRKYFLMNKLEE
jgi:hypothetical protein